MGRVEICPSPPSVRDAAPVDATHLRARAEKPLKRHQFALAFEHQPHNLALNRDFVRSEHRR
jgi:hypothetical protein